MAAYLGYTLRMRMLFRGWPIMVNDTHTRRRRRLAETDKTKRKSELNHEQKWWHASKNIKTTITITGQNIQAVGHVDRLCSAGRYIAAGMYHKWLEVTSQAASWTTLSQSPSLYLSAHCRRPVVEIRQTLPVVTQNMSLRKFQSMSTLMAVY